MKRHQHIVEQLESMDFSQLPKQNFGASTGAYFVYAPSHGAEVQKYMTARYLVRADAYELMFGLNCSALRNYFQRSKLIESSVAEAIAQLNNERPHCWYRLPIRFGSRVNSWSCPSAANEMERLFLNEIRTFIDKWLMPVDSADSLLRAYLKDEEPFEWRLGTSYFARMCEVAYLVVRTGSSHTMALNLANKYHPFLKNSDLFGSKQPREFFPELVKSIELELSLSNSR